MKIKVLLSFILGLSVILLLGCPNPVSSSKKTEITRLVISGVTVPALGTTPVTAIVKNSQYNGTVSWSPEVSGTFAPSMVYTATIKLKAKSDYTFKGVNANSFSVAGASSVTHSANSGMITAVFPATGAAPDTVINIAAIPGVSVPVMSGTPVNAIAETAQYTGTVSWSPVVNNIFVSNTTYTATITLTAKAGYTLTGVAIDLFTIAGAASNTNAINSGVVTAVFPMTPANLAAVTDYMGTSVGTLKAVQGGTFNNGTADMTVSSFRMSRYEVTRAQFLAVMGTDPSDTIVSSGTNDPVQRVNWYHAISFCNKLSLAEGLTPVYNVNGITDWVNLAFSSIPADVSTLVPNWSYVTADWSANGYRLPTEAEWQFAARGGNFSNNYTYAGSNTIGDIAWYTSNSGGKTHPIGEKAVNELGIYDMTGNVREWCWDRYSGIPGAYPASSQIDYRGGTSLNGGIFRGGSWNADASTCTVVTRGSQEVGYRSSSNGFRVVRP